MKIHQLPIKVPKGMYTMFDGRLYDANIAGAASWY